MRESKEYELPAELKQIEAQFAAFSAAPAGLNRDRLMYRAGWEAALRAKPARGGRRYAWPAVAGVMTAATVALAVTLALEGTVQRGPQHIAVVNGEAAEPPPDSPSPGEGRRGGAESPTDPALADRPPTYAAPPHYTETFAFPSGDAPQNYLALRQIALHRGVDALPEHRPEPRTGSQPEDRPPATAHNLLRELLPPEAPVARPAEKPDEAIQSPPSDEEPIV